MTTEEKLRDALATTQENSGELENENGKIALKAQSIGKQAVGAQAIGSMATGALAVGAVAIGALAIGRLVIGRLNVSKSHFRSLEIDDLYVHRVRVGELIVTDELVKRPEGVIET